MIPNGMIYIADHPGSAFHNDPSIIRRGEVVHAGAVEKLRYYPSWEALQPAQKHAYLAWLASGRTAPVSDPGYIFVFLYGLERRLFIDLVPRLHANDAHTETRQIQSEVEALIDRYGDLTRSLVDHGTRFLDVLEVLAATHHTEPRFSLPTLSTARSSPPLALRAVIGISSRDQLPLSANWALAWAWFFPETRLRTPAHRCHAELRSLFGIRYQETFGAGLIPRAAASEIRMTYQPLNMSLSEQHIQLPGVPNTFDLKRDARKLVKLLDDVTTELDSYSRWLGRSTTNPQSLEGASLLPPELISPTADRFAPFDRWIRQHLTDPRGTVMSSASLISRWTSSTAEKLTKAQSSSLAVMLEALGYGIEPDVRYGGPMLRASTPIVLFKLERASPADPSPEFNIAKTVVHLSAAVASADSSTTAEEVRVLHEHVDAILGIPAGEQDRLYAYLVWLNAQPVRLTGLQKHIQAMPADQRAATGDLLLTVIAADGAATPDEIKLLTRIYKMLGLDPGTITSHLHAILAGDPDPGTFHLTAPASSVMLDPKLIRRKQQETAAVSSLLAEVFAEEPDEEMPSTSSETPCLASDPSLEPGDAPLDGLDALHSSLLRQALAQTSWERQRFAELADELGLMPDGAIDTINEFALDTIGEFLIEGDDPLEIVDYTRQELGL